MKIKNGVVPVVFVVILISLGMAAPVLASDETVTVAGVISKITPSDNTIVIQAKKAWNGESWTGASVTIKEESLKGTFNDSAAFSELSVSDPVQATYIKTSDPNTVNWLCIGKTQTSYPTGKYLSDAFGDPKYIISPFFNNFKLTYATYPNCSDCSGSVCSASYANLRVSQGWESKNYAYEYTIKKGERHVFTSPEGCESELSVTFAGGEATSDKCYITSEEGKPVSDFKISVVQKGTVSDMTPAPVVTMTQTETQTATPEETQSPGFFALTALFGIAIVAACILSGKKD
ncbi:hypothetical protein J2128_002263 [Methanomicrobium sp. W14]|uniref:hypothetical protein n=1 Tax=Methanomicrobium sp. W14 TaxID=2817839 RepID=UPI001AE3BAD9|nr:hypothetical protein [Methanomicrobium sp. W14]MBP2134297.1 hypothetical protein [Methanomicrobium sp. W14]